MNRKTWILGAVAAAVLGAGSATFLLLRGPGSGDAARAAYAEYDAAFRSGDVGGVKARMSAENVNALDRDPRVFETAAKMRPDGTRILSCTVDGDRAVLRLRGKTEGTPMSGVASLVREDGAWKVAKEDWTIRIDPDPPPVETLPENVRELVDRVASENPMEATKAWLEIGARYRSASRFLKEVKPALWDPRPVHFEMTDETFEGKDRSFRYFTVKTPSCKGEIVPADTVGEALRYHLWQYEDVSGTGFDGTFDEWWSSYAPPLGLPGGG